MGAADGRQSLLRELSTADAGRYEARAAAEPLLYTQAFPERWRTFRVARLTALMQRLHDVVKTTRPTTIVSARRLSTGAKICCPSAC